MSTAKITVTGGHEGECAMLLFKLAPETWKKITKDNVIGFLEKQIPKGAKR